VSNKPANRKVLSDGQLDRAIDPEYAAVSPMAIVGLALACAGIGAFFVPPLAALPLLGFVVSLAAWRHIRRSQGVLAGRSLAQVGMVLGAALTVTSVAFHFEVYREQRQVYDLVGEKANDAVRSVLGRNYEKVYTSMPEEFRKRQAPTVQAFGGAFDTLMKDAGALKTQTLTALTPVMTKEKILIQKVLVRVDFEKRSFEFQLWYMPDATRQWGLIGVGCAETFDSQVKNQGETTPAPAPVSAPVRQDHSQHDHGD
jgi:hypothetical protein